MGSPSAESDDDLELLLALHDEDEPESSDEKRPADVGQQQEQAEECDEARCMREELELHEEANFAASDGVGLLGQRHHASADDADGRSADGSAAAAEDNDDDLNLLLALADDGLQQDGADKAPPTLPAAASFRTPKPEPAFARADGRREAGGRAHVSGNRQPPKQQQQQPPAFKGFRVKQPLIPSVVLNEQFAEHPYLPLHQLRKAADLLTPWSTLGVIGRKGKAKASSSGNAFAVLSLTDLSGSSISLFVFGKAYQAHWKESEGALLVVFDAKMRRDDDGGRSLSVFDAEQIRKVGTAADFGFCKGTRKDGGKCTMPVNVRECEWCEFHISEALRRLKTKRRPGSAEDGVTRRLNAVQHKRERIAKKLGVFWAGPPKPRPQAKPGTSGGTAGATKAKELHAFLGKQQREQSRGAKLLKNLVEAKNGSGENAVGAEARPSSRKLPPPAKKQPPRPGARSGGCRFVELDEDGDLGGLDDAWGAQLFAERAGDGPKRASEAGTGAIERPLKAARPGTPRFSAPCTQAEAEASQSGQGRQRLGEAGKAAPEPQGMPQRKRQTAFREPGAGLNRASLMVAAAAAADDSRRAPAKRDESEPAKERIREMAQAAGGVKELMKNNQRKAPAPPRASKEQQAPRPTSTPNGPPSGIRQLRATELNRRAGAGQGPKPPPLQPKQKKSAFAAMFAGVTKDADEQLESMYKDAAEAEEDDLIDKQLAFAEQKDKIATKMEETREIQVKAWKCLQCDITLEMKLNSCREKGHEFKPVKGIKRFFKCQECGRRETSINKIRPSHPCHGCRSRSFKQVGMRDAGKGGAGSAMLPKAVVSAEDMLARGTEQAFSLQQALDLKH